MLFLRAAFHTPKVPKIPGIEKFTGTTVHSVHFNRHQEEFRDKRVLIIGLHASTQDVVMALKNHGAAQVYATHRNGVALVSSAMISYLLTYTYYTFCL